MIAAAESRARREGPRNSGREAHELHLIFATIYRKVSTKQDKPE